jgi:hypothetical protein
MSLALIPRIATFIPRFELGSNSFVLLASMLLFSFFVTASITRAFQK